MKRISRFSLAVGSALLILAGLAVARTAGSGYHLLRKYSFGPAKGAISEYFDYVTVDSAARRVYLARGTEVQVIDASSGASLGVIAGMQRVHGVALAPALGLGFITDGGRGLVTSFDLATLKPVARIKAEPDADCVVYDPATRRVFTMNGDPHSSTVIDAKTGKVIRTLPLGGAPEFAVADGKGMLYANLASTNQLVAIDTRSLAITARWPVAPAGHPTALAIDVAHRRLFSAGRNPQRLVVLDADSGKVIRSFPIGADVDAARFDPATGLIFVSTFEGRVDVFHEDAPDVYSALAPIPTQTGAKTMGLDTKTHDLYLDTANFAPAPARAAGRRRRRRAIPGTFRVLVYGR